MQLNNINSKKLGLAIIILLLILGNIFFGVKYFSQKKETIKIEEELQSKKTNGKVVNFLSLFIEKVLKTDKEITFENRLKLENSVRDIGDQEILYRWEQFVAGTTESEIQERVKDLLSVLVNKITY